MLPKENNTLKSWVDFWPTYLVLGVALAHLIDRTQIINQISNKLFRKEKTTDDTE